MSNSGGGGGTIVRPPLNEDQQNGRACAICGWKPLPDNDIRFFRGVGKLGGVEINVCSRAVPAGCWIPTLNQLTSLYNQGVSIYLSVGHSSRLAEVPQRIHVRDDETGGAPLPGVS